MTGYIDGIIVGAVIIGMIMGFIGYFLSLIIYPYSVFNTTELEHVEKIRKAEIDCLVKEYYYMDEHRPFCDMIGVNP